MTSINAASAQAWLERLATSRRQMPGTGRRRMELLMRRLGNPQNRYPMVHLAGTSGKSSTAHYIAALAGQAGQTVGLAVSPHVDDVRERVQVNLKMLLPSRFWRELAEFCGQIQPVGPQLSYAEALMAFAFWYFARAGVDLAVIETGVGGLVDATNVSARPDKICVITDIGLDHTRNLGRTLTAIATHKAGIITPGSAVFCFRQRPTVNNVIAGECQRQGAKLHMLAPAAGSPSAAALPLFGERNWRLAQAVHRYLERRNGWPPLTPGQTAAARSVYIPARMELISYGKKTLIIDAAHNPQKIRALMQSVEAAWSGQPVAALVAFGDKGRTALNASLKALTARCGYIVATDFTVEGSLRPAVPAAEIAAAIKRCGHRACRAISPPQAALKVLLKRPEPVFLITGSFYLLNHIRPLLIRGPLKTAAQFSRATNP